MIRPGMEWDASVRPGRWKRVDYSKLTLEQLKERRQKATDSLAEYEAQVKAFLPAATAQTVLNAGMIGLQDLLIKLAKEAPKLLAKAV